MLLLLLLLRLLLLRLLLLRLLLLRLRRLRLLLSALPGKVARPQELSQDGLVQGEQGRRPGRGGSRARPLVGGGRAGQRGGSEAGQGRGRGGAESGRSRRRRSAPPLPLRRRGDRGRGVAAGAGGALGADAVFGSAAAAAAAAADAAARSGGRADGDFELQAHACFLSPPRAERKKKCASQRELAAMQNFSAF